MEDWGADANAPTFSLFAVKSTPQEQAVLDTFVNPVIYNRWSKAERRLYQKLKTESIAKKIESQKIETFDELAKELESLNSLKEKPSDERDPSVDDLIAKVSTLKISASRSTART